MVIVWNELQKCFSECLCLCYTDRITTYGFDTRASKQWQNFILGWTFPSECKESERGSRQPERQQHLQLSCVSHLALANKLCFLSPQERFIKFFTRETNMLLRFFWHGSQNSVAFPITTSWFLQGVYTKNILITTDHFQNHFISS